MQMVVQLNAAFPLCGLFKLRNKTIVITSLLVKGVVQYTILAEIQHYYITARKATESNRNSWEEHIMEIKYRL